MPVGDNLKNWRTLSEQVLREEDPAKFMDLVEGLIEALDRETTSPRAQAPAEDPA